MACPWRRWDWPVAETIPDDERGTLNKEALSPDLYLNLLDPKRWPAMCRAHLRTDVIKKFEAYYEDFTHRRRHDAVAYISILRSAAAICEEDLTPPGMKKVRMHVIAQIQLVIGRFEFWRDEARQGTAAAAAGEAALLNQNFPKAIQEARKASDRVARHSSDDAEARDAFHRFPSHGEEGRGEGLPSTPAS